MTLRANPDSTTFLHPIRFWHRQAAFDVVIVGAGIAGLAMALRLPAEKRVAVVTKGHLGESNTRYAQGGFAAPIGPDDEVELHVADTLAAGAGLSDAAAVRDLISGAADAVAWLVAAGTRFDLDDGEIELGREAAHSRNRILHAGGDATGAEIERALVARLKQRATVTILDRTMAIDLVVESGICRGVIVNQAGSRDLVLLTAQETVLANGGAGQLWAVTSNPPGATGDGIAMALRAGVVVADLEFAQFHPTVLAVPGGEGFLISEAVRGEGAYLRDAAGHRFMLDVDPRAELAPRDIVARAIQRQMALDGTISVDLDLRHLDPELVRRRFPTIAAHLATLGLDLTSDLIPVAPAAHYFMGGVVASPEGATSLPGLRAIGEVSCTGVHGANRLASNSLLEGLVFGLRTADAIVDEASSTPAATISPAGSLAFAASGAGTTDDSVESLRGEMKAVMSAHVAVVRSAESLADAGTTIAAIGHEAGAISPMTPRLLELRNMTLLAGAIAASASHREESRGSHFRSDIPATNPDLDGMHQFVQRRGDEFVRGFGSLRDVIAPSVALSATNGRS